MNLSKPLYTDAKQAHLLSNFSGKKVVNFGKNDAKPQKIDSLS